MPRGFTKKQRAFIAEYVADPSIDRAEAARRAGFGIARAKITASELWNNPDIKREIDRQLSAKYPAERQAEDKLNQLEGGLNKRGWTPEDWCKDHDKLVEMCRSAGPVAWAASTLTKLLELKGKYLKLLTDKVEVDLSDKLIARLEAGRRNAGLLAPQLPKTIDGEVVQ